MYRMIKVGINGFGSIGRQFFRIAESQHDFEVVGINDLTDTAMLAHLLQFDSTYGPYPSDVSVQGRSIAVGGRLVRVFAEHNPGAIPWGSLGVDVVIEASGRYTDGNQARGHIQRGGAQKVIITAPATHEDFTIVLGVNEAGYQGWQHHVLSMASCTTNCVAPVAKVLDMAFGIQSGFMTTVHAYTNEQKLLDAPAENFRLARSAAQNIVPMSTGAGEMLDLVLPQLRGRIHSVALRVPTPTVSIIDLTVNTKVPTTATSINDVFYQASQGPLRSILQVSSLPLVSSDFKGNSHSAIIESLETAVVDDTCVKVLAWYDNEWAYSHRLVDLVRFIAERDKLE
jgi:glyceraldehyde 3-phosphate dehydrogenase